MKQITAALIRGEASVLGDSCAKKGTASLARGGNVHRMRIRGARTIFMGWLQPDGLKKMMTKSEKPHGG